jgi:prophage tail gpP-like protein
MPGKVQLVIEGRAGFEGWLDFAVSQAIDAGSGAFSLSYTEKWSDRKDLWELLPGMACEVRIDGETVVNGYIEMIQPRFSARTHLLNLQGRDKTADLIDCSADHSPGQWSNITTVSFAKILARPFGIKVTADVPEGAPLTQVRLQQGETCMAAIYRYCLMRKQLAMPDGAGGLLITRAGATYAETSLVQGKNILEAQGVLDDSQRYSDYVVRAQAPYSLDSDSVGEAHITGRAKDPLITRYRPLVMVAENAGNLASVKARAEWEATVRLGRATNASIMVKNWRQQPNGSLWKPNLLVSVDAPWLKIKGDMLIREILFRSGQGGESAELSLVSPQAYASEPPKKVKEKGENPWLADLAEARQ